MLWEVGAGKTQVALSTAPHQQDILQNGSHFGIVKQDTSPDRLSVPTSRSTLCEEKTGVGANRTVLGSRLCNGQRAASGLPRISLQPPKASVSPSVQEDVGVHNP